MWVTRDKDGTLKLHSKKPWFVEQTPGGYLTDYWTNDDSENIMYLDESLFPEITWKSAPLEVGLISMAEKRDFETYRIFSLSRDYDNFNFD